MGFEMRFVSTFPSLFCTQFSQLGRARALRGDASPQHIFGHGRRRFLPKSGGPDQLLFLPLFRAPSPRTHGPVAKGPGMGALVFLFSSLPFRIYSHTLSSVFFLTLFSQRSGK